MVDYLLTQTKISVGTHFVKTNPKKHYPQALLLLHFPCEPKNRVTLGDLVGGPQGVRAETQIVFDGNKRVDDLWGISRRRNLRHAWG